MRKLLRLWWRLYWARRVKSKVQPMVRLATAEEAAKVEDGGRLVETFWRLKYRSSRARVRVYRVPAGAERAAPPFHEQPFE
jgi:hypothetical protein